MDTGNATRKKDAFEKLPAKGNVIFSDDIRMEGYREDTMMRGSPDALVIPASAGEVRDILSYCNAHRLPVTFCGSRTSMTGASVPMEGLLISTEKLCRVIDIDGGDLASVVCEPGVVVAELQRTVAEAGFFHPVAPTSRDECRIGGNVSTNATGEDSYKYGPVRGYVQELEIILPDGSMRTLAREPDEIPSRERNRAGYFTEWMNPIDLIVGSEGTLAFVSKIRLSLLAHTPNFFSLLIPHPSTASALDMVMQLVTGATDLKPRAVELIDERALAMMRTAHGFSGVQENVAAMLYVKQEYENVQDRDVWLARWYDYVLGFAGDERIDSFLVALTQADQERFRLWRHRIPEGSNEFGRAHWEEGGGKVGSDWWVPLKRIPEMMDFFYKRAHASGLPFMAYAHIGAGHPHTNLLCRNASEKAIAHEVLLDCCRKAVSLGGGVAGEHGIGKLHTDLMPVQHNARTIERMKEWKRCYDPNWILGRGTIFETGTRNS